MTSSSTTAVLLDLDGTLVDSVYVHVLAWYEALHTAGRRTAMYRIHAGIGMGSDRLLPWLDGGHDDGHAEIAADHTQRFLDRADLLVATDGALALLDDLERRNVPYVVATSAGDTERGVLLQALGREDVPIVGADDVAASKPAMDLLAEARHALPTPAEHCVMVGDAPWDALAAVRAGIEPVAVRCGGFGDASLHAAGARRIVDAPRDLIGTL